MTPPGNETDVDFFNLIHQLARAVPENEAAERRTERRQPFLASQRMAPMAGPDVPDESEFGDVACHDLSSGGFSFFLAHRPDFHRLAVAFGAPPKVIYMAAEVSHCQNVLVSSSGEVRPIRGPAGRVDREDLDDATATPMVLVGCRFSRRLYK